MKGVYTALATIAVLISLLLPMRASAQALPQLPVETLTQLQLIQSDAQNLAMASEGLNVYDNSSANTLANIALFGSLYRTLQAWNNWIGGDDYQVTRAYVMERTQLPDWLANYAGDVIFWELDYFGHTIEMLTDQDGYILNRNDEEHEKVEPAVNCRIKHTMIEAVEKYKVENPDKNEAMVVESFVKPSAYMGELQAPYLVGKELNFFVFVGGNVDHYRITNFTNCILSVYAPTYTGVYSMYLVKQGNNLDNVEVYKNGVKFNNENISISVFNWYSGIHGSWSFNKAFVIPLSQYGDITSFNYPAYYTLNSIASGYYEGIHSNNYSGVLQNTKYQESPIGDIYVASKAIREVTNNQSLGNIVNTPISSSSLQEITDAISQIEPQTDPETGIEILPIPQEFPLPEALPLESEEPAPPIPPGIEDFPSSDPSQVPAQNPNVEPSTTPTEDSLPDSAEEIQPMEELQLVTGLQNRFPFSIPWDIYNAYRMLQAEKEPPVWTWDMVVNLPTGGVFTHTFTLSMEPVDSLVTLFRDLFLLAFILGLAIYSYNKFFGGGA